MTAPLTVALLGGGTVGSATARLLAEHGDELASRIGRPLVLTGVAVRDAGRARPGVDPALITTDIAALAASGADIVVEVIGGIEPAKTLIESALSHGSSVVTANKALLASHGAQLHKLAEANDADQIGRAHG